MNCKPGDLAILLRAIVPANVGMVVEVIRPSAAKPGAWICRAMRPRLAARTGRPDDLQPRMEARAMDRDLRPIRDQPGADETLTWAPVPTVRTKEMA